MEVLNPLTNKKGHISFVLHMLASQENCDGEPYDQMIAAADYILKLEKKLKPKGIYVRKDIVRETDILKAVKAYNKSKPGKRRGNPKPEKIYKDDIIDMVVDLLLLIEKECGAGKEVLEMSRRHFLSENKLSEVVRPSIHKSDIDW